MWRRLLCQADSGLYTICFALPLLDIGKESYYSTDRFMPTYRAFNLTIASEITLPELPYSDATTPDIAILKGDVSRAGLADPQVVRPYSQIAPNELWLHIPHVAWFHVSDGNQIIVEPEADTDEQTIRLYLLGSCMGAILHQRNQLVIHGNAIRIGDECVIFAGHSGAGKSTLAAAFYRRGYEVLADDLAVVDDDYRVVPAYPRMKLWSDSAKQLEIDIDDLKQIRSQIEKYSYPMAEGFCNTPLPVRAIYLLNSHNQPDFQFEAITGFEKFNPLKNNTYRIGYLKGLGLNATHLKRCSGLANRISLTRITRPNDGFQLDELVERIESDLKRAKN
jgi:hypothetical protein